MKKKRLGEVLYERGQISAADLKKALLDQQGRSFTSASSCSNESWSRKNDLLTAITEVAGVPYQDCSTIDPPAEALKLIPVSVARRDLAIPVRLDGKSLVVAMAKPQNVQILDELQFKTGLKIVPRFAFHEEIAAAVDRLYPSPSVTVETVQVADDMTGMEFISSSSQQRNVEAMREMQQELHQKSRSTPAVHLVAQIIRAAAAKLASDIHIEPQAGETSVRFRVDGILRRVSAHPPRPATSGGLPPQDSFRHGYCRAPESAGWPVRRENQCAAH